MTQSLQHVKGSLVRQPRTHGAEDRIGQVIGVRDDGQLIVEWLKPQKSRDAVTVKSVRNGLTNGVHVVDATPLAGSRSLGQGQVMQTRTLAGSEQALVDFPELGKRHWLPYQHLRAIPSVEQRFKRLSTPTDEEAERCRLRLLAQALLIWQENSGALARLDIDPLPHQINLVHHILNSGNLNWLIADDVGLGKTIETGMLLHALNQRGLARRVLLITPAGLTRQWQEELYHKFRFDDFRIFGDDFHINASWQWKGLDRVIASLDTLKQEAQLESILQTENWDLIIFDEAHRLSRRQYGLTLKASERFELARHLRAKSENLLLLSATPHQGMQDKFIALLELLRPERKRDFDLLSLKPEILHDMVFRNHKADVTDAEGNFIFQGKITRAIEVPSSKDALTFDQSLQSYLRKGYEAGKQKGRTGQAIGFVMTVYRKLAASSAAAIYQALCNRLSRLSSIQFVDDDLLLDARYEGEWEEQQSGSNREFFDGERELLLELIEQARILVADDIKVARLLDSVVHHILTNNPQEKVLIFTEYKSTQAHLQSKLAAVFGNAKVELLNGSMHHRERREAIARFEDAGQFLISTEAGGEGINLQRHCHIMVNFDLPWNPMRLVQRIGRLYRYGQSHRVVVFNMHQSDSLDLKIIELMYSRIDTVVNDMATVLSQEFNEGLKEEILGEFADLIDIQEILEEATLNGILRSQERIDDAIKKAQDATHRQRDLLQYAASGEKANSRQDLRMTMAHLESFAIGMLKLLDVEYEAMPRAQVFRIRLNESLMKALNMPESASSRIDITFDRAIAINRPNTVMMDMDAALMKHLINAASLYEFGGQAAAIHSTTLGDGVLFGAQLRWQSLQGRLMRRELMLAHLGPQGETMNSPEIHEWLLDQGMAAMPLNKPASAPLFEQLKAMSDERLEQVSNSFLMPQSRQWIAACWTAGGYPLGTS